MNDAEIATPVVKAVVAVGLSLGGWSLSDINQVAGIVASGAGFLLSCHYIGEWYWKKFWRPLLRRWCPERYPTPSVERDSE